MPLRSPSGCRGEIEKIRGKSEISVKKSEMPEVGWVAEPEIHAKIRNPIQKAAGWSSSQNNEGSIAKTSQI
jgi:hypothetical protein